MQAPTPSTSTCAYGKFGCKGRKKHKTQRSKDCANHVSKRGGLTLEALLTKWSTTNDLILYESILSKSHFLFLVYHGKNTHAHKLNFDNLFLYQ